MIRPDSESAGIKAIRARAAEWLVERRSSDHWDDVSQKDLEAWLAESPAHMVEFLRLEAAWNRTDRLAALRQPQRRLFGGNTRMGSVLVRAAAGLALVTVAGMAALQFSAKPAYQTYSTTVGGRETLRLADGSTVELNTDSVVQIDVSGGQRHVWLEKGEAYFQIVHDSARPFVVLAGDHRVTDLGTKFSVRRQTNSIEVSLIEGRARLDATNAANPHHAVLEPGDVAFATPQSLTVKRQKPEILQAALGWRHDMLVFHHATLSQAAAEFNRYNREKLTIGDAYAAAQTFNGTLPTNDVSAFVRVTQKTFGLHVTKQGNETIISR